MTKTHRKQATTADEAFNKHYASIWGEDRWRNSLHPALLKPTRYACLLNRYASLDASRQLIQDDSVETVPLSLPHRENDENLANDLPPNCYVRVQKPASDQEEAKQLISDVPFPSPSNSSGQLQTHWNLDAASVLVAHLLDVRHGDNVLDLCAAPGGKSITLAQNIWCQYHEDDSPLKRRAQEDQPVRIGSLHSNETDGPRQRRLAENLQAYLPRPLFTSKHVSALRIDGTNPKAQYELMVKTSSGTVGYDKVLIDAPCSSERHIIHAHARAKLGGRIADEMANWRPGSTKRLAETQLKLLMAGLKAVKMGGTVMYATCSIEPTENDGVIEKMLSQVEKERKKGVKWSVKIGFNQGKGNEALEGELGKSWAERTKHGWIVLPDHPSGGGWGPLFFAVLTKVAD